MFSKYCGLLLIPGLLLAGGCCCPERIKTATDIQMEAMDETKCLAGAHFVHMVDNAMLQDMAIFDHHFVPHTAEISGTGAMRLDRFAPLLNTYGGVVRYQTYCEDEALVARRIEHVREYLALAECDMDRVEVKRAMSGGRGMTAREAIEAKARGTARPESESAGGMSLNLGG